MSKNLVDEFLEGIGNAIHDVREKAVEEAWFGKPVTDNIAPSLETQTPEPVADEPGSKWQEYVKESRTPADRDEMPSQDHGFDR